MNFPSITADRASQRQDRGPILRVGSDDAVWALTPWSGASAQRFSRFVQDLPSHLEHIQPALGFLSSAIAYDCVLSESDLIAMAEMASSTSAPNIGIRATWKSDRGGYLHDEVRCLSWRTRLIARRLPPKVNWSVAVDELRGFLQKNYPELNTSDHRLVMSRSRRIELHWSGTTSERVADELFQKAKGQQWVWARCRVVDNRDGVAKTLLLESMHET